MNTAAKNGHASIKIKEIGMWYRTYNSRLKMVVAVADVHNDLPTHFYK